MRHEWLAYAIVAVLSIGAGAVIAGRPLSSSAGPTIIVSATAATTVPEPVVTVVPDDTTAPSEPPTTEAAESPTTTDAALTTTTTTTTTTIPEPVLPSRSALAVVVANGADIGGIAGKTARELETAGYVDVRVTDGTDIVLFTIVYYAEGFEASAERLADDVGVDPDTAIAPIEDAPDIFGDVQDENLLVYLGTDQR